MIEEIVRNYRNLTEKVECVFYGFRERLYEVLVPKVYGLCYARPLENGGRSKHHVNGKNKGKGKRDKKKDRNWRKHVTGPKQKSKT